MNDRIGIPRASALKAAARLALLAPKLEDVALFGDNLGKLERLRMELTERLLTKLHSHSGTAAESAIARWDSEALGGRIAEVRHGPTIT